MQISKPLVSIIITCFNDLKYLKTLVPDIKKNTSYPNYEIIVIDNGSKKNFKPWLEKTHPDIICYRLEQNIGFGKANNIGMKKAKGKYLLLLNSDTSPQPNWLEYMVDIAESNSQIGLVGCLFMPYDFMDKHFLSAQKIFFLKVPEIIGCCILYRKDLSEETSIGLFDRYLFQYAEDEDLCLRIWLHGYQVVLTTSSYIYHRGSGPGIFLKDKSSRQVQLLTHFYLYFLTKWFSWWTILIAIIRLSMDSLTSLIYKRKIAKFKGFLKGLVDYFIDFSFTYSVRNDMKKKFPNIIRTQDYIRYLSRIRLITKNGEIPLTYAQNLFDVKDNPLVKHLPTFIK
jgi:GT2 family glycosyltransferase